MEGTSFLTLAGYFAFCILASLAVLWLTGKFMSARAPARRDEGRQPSTENTFLFRHGILADHDSTLTDTFAGVEDWPALKKWLSHRFVDVPAELQEQGQFRNSYSSKDSDKDPATLTIETDKETSRVILNDPVPPQVADRHEVYRLQRLHDRAVGVLKHAPCAIWRTDHDGRIVWRNDACLDILGDAIEEVMHQVDLAEKSSDRLAKRVSVGGSRKLTPTWFEVYSTTANQYRVYYATDITYAVQAEANQREFVQTLTKTFANLTTGLAIFDRKRQLALFNPALVDLTGLPAEFLSGRPELMSLFDKLRDRQVMPEPKNYSDWRAQINQMIEAASDGLYQETWSLPTGVTYRVTGRPHPDGAVAFLFEDISAEISLTRRFRAQNDLRQSVLDKIDHAVAVVASNNVVIFCNAAWTRIFGVDPDTSFAELSLTDLLAVCRQKFPHPEFWRMVETQITTKTIKHPLDQLIDGQDDMDLQCTLSTAAGGAVLICRPLPHDTKSPAIKVVGT